MRLRFIVALGIILALIAGLKLLVPTRVADASAILKQSCAGFDKLDYSGTVTSTVSYCGHKIITRSTVRHKGKDERIEYLSGPVRGVVIINTGKENRIYQPNTGKIIISQTVDSTRHDLVSLLNNYKAIKTADGSVAGRKVNIISLESKHNGPARKLWIDRKTGIILKSEEYSTDGRLRSRTEFTKISYAPQHIEAVNKLPDTVEAKWTREELDIPSSLAEVEKTVGIRTTLPAYMPGGYSLESASVYNCVCGCGNKAIHLRYTDGLNSISIYETPGSSQYGSNTCKIHCATKGRCVVADARQAQVATISIGKITVIVVADLSEAEITRIVDSIH